MHKILFVRTDRLGDCLMTIPVIHCLRQNYPQSLIHVLCDQKTQEVFCYHLDVSEVLAYDTTAFKSWSSKWNLYWRLKREKFKCIIISNPSKMFHVMAFLLGIPIRVGYDRKSGFLLNRKVEDKSASSTQHQIDMNLALVKAICPKSWNRTIQLGNELHPQYQMVVKEKGLLIEKKIIVLHLTSSNKEKEINLDLFKALLQLIFTKKRYQVVLVGQERRDEIQKVLNFEKEGARFVNLIGQTNLTELSIILNEAHCVVSVDSGPFHLAWMQRTPTIGIFLPDAIGSNPTRWGVYPSFAPHVHFYEPAKELTAQKILAAIESLIGTHTGTYLVASRDDHPQSPQADPDAGE